MNQPVKRKRIPYGMMNFIDVREETVITWTRHIISPLIEKREQSIFFLHSPHEGSERA